MLREAVDFVAAAWPLIRHPHRYEIVKRVTDELRWCTRNRIPVDYFTRLLPEVKDGSPLHVGDISHPFELPYAERYFVAGIASAIRPRQIFEFGTVTGTTTRLLADSAPGASVHTLDLPGNESCTASSRRSTSCTRRGFRWRASPIPGSWPTAREAPRWRCRRPTPSPGARPPTTVDPSGFRA